MRDLALTAVALLLPAVALAQTTVDRGPYLMIPHPTAMTVLWRTDAPTVDSVVQWGNAPGGLGSSETDPGAKSQHAVRITGLSAGQKVYYSVGFTGTELAGNDADHYFTTPPAFDSTEPFRVWFVGDPHSSVPSGGNDASGLINSMNGMLAWVGGNLPDLMITGGDMAGIWSTQAEFDWNIFDALRPMMIHTPWLTTTGNHDCVDPLVVPGPFVACDPIGQCWLDNFASPAAGESTEDGDVVSGSEFFYSVDWGNAHFAMSDYACTTPRGVDGANAVWLTADLAANDNDWTIVFEHYNPYADCRRDADAGTGNQIVRALLAPIWEGGGADLLVAGHDHCYERSFLIRGLFDEFAKIAFDPLVHMVQGGLGGCCDGVPYTKPGGGPVANSGTVYIMAGGSTNIAPICGDCPEQQGEHNHPIIVKQFYGDTVNGPVTTGSPPGDGDQGSFILDFDDQVLNAYYIHRTGTAWDHFQMRKEAP